MAPVIGYVGMTHLGINSAAAAAAREFDVVCFDTDGGLIKALAAGELPVTEPDLPELFAEHAVRLHFSTDSSDLARCDVVYVAPDIATDDNGQSDLNGITRLIAIADDAMRDEAVMVILSQVPPGFTRGLARPVDKRYCQVETLIFGRAVDRALNPERFIVGCADPAQPLPAPLATFLAAFDCPVLPMRYESAELCKISINAFLVASVTTTNTLAEICERIGADWSEIAPALRLDKRIGPHAYLKPGLGISGGNLERDLATIVSLADSQGTDARLVRAFIHNSAYRKNWPLRALYSVLPRHPLPKVGVLGLAYKEDTDSVKNSPSVQLIRNLPHCPITAYDPAVPENITFGATVTRAQNAIEACRGAAAVAVMTPWRQFRELAPAEIAAVMEGDTVIDPYAVLEAEACAQAGLRHLTLGFARVT